MYSCENRWSHGSVSSSIPQPDVCPGPCQVRVINPVRRLRVCVSPARERATDTTGLFHNHATRLTRIRIADACARATSPITTRTRISTDFVYGIPNRTPPPSPTGRYQPYLPYLPDAPDPAVVDKRVSQSTPTTRPPTLPTYSTVRSTLHRLLFDLETTNRNPYHVVVPTSLGESQTLTRSFRHRGVPNHTLQRQGNP